MRRVYKVLLGLGATLLVAPPPAALAIVNPVDSTELDALQRSVAGITDDRRLDAYEAVAARLADRPSWEALRATLGPGQSLYFDLRTGEPSLVSGAPVPLVPGSGNDLAATDGKAVDADLVGAAVEAFVARHAHYLQVPRSELVRRSVRQVNDEVWVVLYDHRPAGIPVAASRVTFIVGHGNLIQWGSENTFALAADSTRVPRLEARQAIDAMRHYVGWSDTRDRLVTGPELVYLPRHGGPPSALDDGLEGRHHQLVWEMVMKREGVRGTWLTQVDVATGTVVQFGDLNRYASVRGGIEPLTWTDAEESRPLPLVSLSTGGFSTIEGQYSFGGGTVTTSLNGQLVEISDQCGSPGFPSVNSIAGGEVDYGTGPPNPTGAADCTTNGVGTSGGAHNTHAARSAYYHITRMKDKARRWLPSNTWLGGTHEVRVNILSTCNAYWSPSGGYNGFFQEGFNSTLGLTCYNTGEIASVFLHEVGHGMDQNDGQGTADGGTGEAYSDVVSILELHRSCIGDVFWQQQCTGYGLPCTACDGIRDADYALHEDGGGNPITTPFTPANYTGPQCPGAFFGAGPCGKEVHCEAYPGTGAIWDLAVRKLPGVLDQATAWYVTERDWLLGTNLSTSMYACNSTTFTSNGCAATSWFSAMRAIDDDDGNLGNGTPHAAQIFAAFNDHAIACGAAGDASNQNSSACVALAQPVLTGSRSGSTVSLSWGAVSGAAGYAVLRNHGDCALMAYQPLTTVATTSFTDTDVASFQPYSYRVVALGAAGGPQDNECYSRLSNCLVPADGTPLFSDGFESGTTSAWSDEAP